MKYFGLIFCLFLGFNVAIAQQNPVEYLNEISSDNERIMNNTWKYLSAVAKNRNAQRIEKTRSALQNDIQNSLIRINKMEAYNNDTALRDSTLSYLQLSFDVMTGNTSKLIDMEAISEKSYDNMEAYIFYQREINEKVNEKGKMVQAQEKRFAKENNVNLIEHKSEISDKIEKTSEVLWYKNLMYLVFFRCAVYEGFMLEATHDQNSEFNFQEAGLLLSQLVDESRNKIDTISEINSDNSLRKKTEDALKFFEDEADELIPAMLDYRKKKNEMDEAEKTIESTPKKNRTKEMINAYNQQVEALNNASNSLNKINESFNKKRKFIFEEWNNTANAFVNSHAPTDDN